MAKVKNKLRQPLTVNLEKGKSIHFLAKEVKEIDDEQLTVGELKSHIEQGNLIVTRIG